LGFFLQNSHVWIVHGSGRSLLLLLLLLLLLPSGCAYHHVSNLIAFIVGVDFVLVVGRIVTPSSLHFLAKLVRKLTIAKTECGSQMDFKLLSLER
jgi:hypothetical protein